MKEGRFKKDEIKKSTRGIVYFCHYSRNPFNIEVIGRRQFDSSFEALETYANTRNPESQIVRGDTYEELLDKLEVLHSNMDSQEWLAELGECL